MRPSKIVSGATLLLLGVSCGTATPPAEPPSGQPTTQSADAPAPSSEPPEDRTAGCPRECKGVESPDLVPELRARSPQARRCYEIATSAQPNFGGRLLVTLELSESGQTCAVTVTSAVMALPEPFVRCLEKAYAGAYPAPKGGCIRAVLPLNFVSENTDAGAPP